MEQYSTNGPICPYCEHRHNPGEDPEIYFDEDLTELTCDACDKEFQVSVYVSWSWTTEPASSVQREVEK